MIKAYTILSTCYTAGMKRFLNSVREESHCLERGLKFQKRAHLIDFHALGQVRLDSGAESAGARYVSVITGPRYLDSFTDDQPTNIPS